MSELKKELLNKGYVVHANNIHGLEGDIMSAGGPGVADVGSMEQTQVTETVIRVYNLFTNKTVAEFNNVPAYIAWCPKISEGGIPGYINGWD